MQHAAGLGPSSREGESAMAGAGGCLVLCFALAWRSDWTWGSLVPRQKVRQDSKDGISEPSLLVQPLPQSPCLARAELGRTSAACCRDSFNLPMEGREQYR